MFSRFSEEAQKILVLAKKEMTLLKHPYVGSEHLLLAILSDKNNDVSKRLEEYNLNYKNFREEIIKIIGIGSESNNWFLYTPLLKRIIENAMLDVRENNDNEVTINHLFLSLLDEGEGIAIRILMGMNIDTDQIYKDFIHKEKQAKAKNKKKLLVEDFGIDLNKKVRDKRVDPVVDRDEEVNRILEILSRRNKNNPLLIGEAGVGKTAIVEEVARRIVTGDVPDNLKRKKIISVAMASLVAGTKYRGEFEERIGKILKEIENNEDIIIFVDEIHTLVGAGGAEGAIDASNILKPALARGKIKLIGATTTDEYKKFIETDKALERRFQIINILEPNTDKVYNMLLKLRPIYESFHGVKVSDEILKLIIRLSNKYIYDRMQPDKAIDVLDEVCTRVSLIKSKDDLKLRKLKQLLKSTRNEKNNYIMKQDFDEASRLREEEKRIEDKINNLELNILNKKNIKVVTKENVADIIKIKTKIPVYEIEEGNITYLNKLSSKLKDKVIGQDEAINELVNITKRIKLGLKKDNTPASFLFVGSTGCGKTMLAKTYSSYLFGEDNLIRLDMSEYKEAHSISKIIGSPPGYVGYSDNKNVLEEIRNKPHSVVLLDEIEKAHPSIVNLFLQILDEGKIKDSKGNVVRFDNNIIIMTSNLGCHKDKLGFVNNKRSEINNRLKESLSVEFINRIDNIIIFNNLNKESIEKIVLDKVKERKKDFKNKGILVKTNNNIISDIISLSNYELFGARKIDKIIASKFDSLVIDSLIAGNNKIYVNSLK